MATETIVKAFPAASDFDEGRDMVLSAKGIWLRPLHRIFTPRACWYGTFTLIWAAGSDYVPTPIDLLVADVSRADVEPITIANEEHGPSDLGPRVRSDLQEENSQPPYEQADNG